MSSPFSVTFANPSRVLNFSGDVLSPLKFIRHMIWPAACFAALAGYFNWYEIKENLDIALSTFSFVQNLVISMLTANLLSRLVMGMTMSYLGIPPQQFGMRLLFGVIPRFFVSTAQIRQLDFPQQRMCYAAPLLTRLGLFAFGVVTWILIRRGGTGAADAALVLGATGLGAFLFTLNPIWRADGYHWMAAWFRMPDLREQSYRLLGLILRRQPIPDMLSRKAIRGLLFYAITSIVFTAALLILVLSSVAFALEQQFRGTGVVMFAVICSLFLAFLISRRSGPRDKSRQKQQQRVVEASHRASVSCYTNPKVISSEAEPAGSEQMANSNARKAKPRRTKTPDPSDVTTTTDLDDILGAPLKRDTGATTALDEELEDILGHVPPSRPKNEFDEILDAALTSLPEPSPEEPAPKPNPRVKADKEPAEPQPPSTPRHSDNLDSVLRLDKSRRAKRSKFKVFVFWSLLLGALYWVAIQPYPFTVGGDFFVRPLERTQVRARTDGEITQILVEEGDWVSNGEIMAILSSWQEKSEVAILEADLVRQKALLETLIAGPKEEEVLVAKQDLRAAETREALAKAEKDRKEALGENTSRKSIEEARSNYELATTLREQAEARLALLVSPVPESEIEASKANIIRKEKELEFSRLRLSHTEIRAPEAGQVVSNMQKISVGAFLKEGELLAELADTRVVMAEIEVPETEIGEADIGADVTLKLWRDPEQSITGTVKRVAPVAEEREFGQVVRVIVEVPNPDGKISRNLTGYGKIIVDDRPVWEVFTRVFIRFFNIEMWSWLP